MATYSKKKPHIVAYRRRKAAANYLQKLSKIAHNSSKKDLGKIIKGLDALHLDILMNLLKIFDDLSSRGEVETKAQKLREVMTKDIIPIPRCYCPACHQPGFLYSPNLDLKGRVFRRFVMHIQWPSMEVKFCEVSPTKTNWIWVGAEPTEGIFVLH